MKIKNSITKHKRYKKLLKEFHPTKNGELKLSDFKSMSNKKVWWKCDKSDDHEWEAMIINRTKGQNCSCCFGYKVVLSNCLATTHPEMAKQWHPTKNGNLTTKDVVAGSHKKVWWKCDKANDHEWESMIKNKVLRRDGCPCCIGRKNVLSNKLAIMYPEIANKWHPTKNGNLTPFDVTAGLNKKVWWKCDKVEDHEWEAVISYMVLSKGSCSCCANRTTVLSNCLATTHPEIANKWHPTKNVNLTPYDLTCGSQKKVWWKCDKANDHEWQGIVVSIVEYETNCPFCNGNKVALSNCLATTHPEIAKEWHQTKNGDLTPFGVVNGHGKKIFWQCKKYNKHIWKTTIAIRKGGSGCPACSESKGEKIIRSFLDKTHIHYEAQKKFDKCIFKRKLAFDFYLTKHNILIEFDGEQHFRLEEFFGGQKEFNKLKLKDAIKTKFAKDNNIPLLRIPYTEFDNIEKIIIDFIKKQNKSIILQ